MPNSSNPKKSKSTALMMLSLSDETVGELVNFIYGKNMCIKLGKRGTKYFYIIFFASVLVALGGWILGSIYGDESLPIDLDATVTEFTTCYGPNPDTGEPLDSTKSFLSDVETIYACGKLNAYSPQSIGTAWFNKRNESGRAFSFTFDDYDLGYFYVPFERPNGGFVSGRYMVHVEHSHRILATAEFVISRP